MLLKKIKLQCYYNKTNLVLQSKIPYLVTINGREVDVSASDALTSAQLNAFVRFLHHYAQLEINFTSAIKLSFDQHSSLVFDLKDALEPIIWQTLFPGCAAASDVTAEQFSQATTLCSIHFWQAEEVIVADYRFCVAKLPENGRIGLRFSDMYDVTDQILAVKAKLDGTVIRVDHES